MKPTFRGEVKNGKLQLKDRDKFTEYVKGLDGRVNLTIHKPKKNRSNNQNRYYWGVVLEVLAEHFGYREDEKQALHESLKQIFLKKDGIITKSTTELTTVEMEEYLSSIRMWASSEYDCYVPEPNELTR